MVQTILTIALGVILVSILITIIRFIKGPSSIDRVVAFDVMSIASIAMIGIISLLSERIIYMDIALVYGLLGFLAVLIIAKYMEKSL